jgi:hypothetical protein
MINLIWLFKSVYRAYVESLIENGETEKAVKLFPRVYTTPKEWEEQISAFIKRNELDVIRTFMIKRT